MSNQPTVLGIIPARGNSKSIPRKNIKDFLGKPLVAWTIETAKKSGALTRLVLSTDDPEIVQIGKQGGAEVPFMRPNELAADTTLMAPVINHCVNWLKKEENWVPDYVLILEATVPSRRPEHIRESVKLLIDSGADSVASISRIPHHHVPEKALILGEDGTIKGAMGMPIKEMIHRRQDLPHSFALNGLIYGCKTGIVLEEPPTIWGDRVMGYPVDENNIIDIDNQNEWEAAEELMRGRFLGSRHE